MGAGLTDEPWVAAVRVLASSISRFSGVPPTERWLTDRLLELSWDPGDAAAAEMSLVASADQMVFTAGLGARFELDPPIQGSAEVEALARAVAAGRLTERVGRWRVRFLIELDDGSELSGSSTPHGPAARGVRRWTSYPAVAR